VPQSQPRRSVGRRRVAQPPQEEQERQEEGEERPQEEEASSLNAGFSASAAVHRGFISSWPDLVIPLYNGRKPPLRSRTLKPSLPRRSRRATRPGLKIKP